MQNKARKSVALIVPAIALATLAAHRAEPRVNTLAPIACSVSTTDTVPVGLKATVLKARYTETVGDSVSASFPLESKIAISAVAPSTMDSPPSIELTLNTERAVPGKWKLSLKGDRGVCAGEVPVVKKVAP